MTTVHVTLSTDHDMAAVVDAAGGDRATAFYENGDLFVPGVTQSALNAAAAGAVVRLPLVTLDGNAWLDRLTAPELTALFTLRRTNVQVDIFLHQLAMGKDVVLRDRTGAVPVRLSAGLDRLVTAGVLTAQRKTDLLAVP